MNIIHRIGSLINIGYLFLSLCILCLVIFFSNKGLDFSDESYNLLFTNPNQPFNKSVFLHDLIFKNIHNIFNYRFSIAEIRVLNVSFLILGSAYLWYTLFKVSKYIKLSHLPIFIFSTFIAFSQGHISLSYNYFITVSSSFFICFVIRFFFEPKKWYLVFLAGLAIYFIYLCKFPSAILLLFACIFIFSIECILKREGWTFKKLLQFLAIILGVNLILFLLFPSTSPFKLASNLKLLSSGYGLGDIMISFLMNNVYFLFFVLLGYVFNKTHGLIKARIFKIVFFNIGFIFVFIYVYIVSWQVFSQSIRLSLFLGFLLGLSLSFIIRSLKTNRERIIVLLLALCPLILFIGTNNPFCINILNYSFYWIALIVFVNQNLFNKILVFILFSSLLAYELRDNLYRTPYRQEPIDNNTEKIIFLESYHFLTKSQLASVKNFNNLIEKSGITSPLVMVGSKMHGELLLSDKIYPDTPIWSTGLLKNSITKLKLPNQFLVFLKTKELKLLDKLKNDFNLKLVGSYEREINFEKSEISCLYLSKK